MWEDKAIRAQQKLENRNWQVAPPQTPLLGVVKFYSRSRGKGTSSGATIPWGFICPITDKGTRKDEPDVHFTLFSLQNVRENLLQKDQVVEYTLMAGTHSAEAVNAVTMSNQYQGRAIVDSGANVHVTNQRISLRNYRPLKSPIHVGTASAKNGVILHGIGDLHVRVTGTIRVFRNVFLCSRLLVNAFVQFAC